MRTFGMQIPCSLGDTMWCIKTTRGGLVPQMGIVSEMYFYDDMKLMIVVKFVGRGEYGQRVFATQEACQQMINILKAKEKANSFITGGNTNGSC